MSRKKLDWQAMATTWELPSEISITTAGRTSYVASVTKNHLYRNNHDGTFTDVTDKAGVGSPMYKGKKMWSAAAGWLDYNNDGKLDLFVSNYCVWEVNKDPVCLSGGRLRAYCHPKFYEPLPSTLYRNNGDGTFTDVSEETGISKKFGKGMGVVFNDYRWRRLHRHFRRQRQHAEFAFSQPQRQSF